MKILTHVALIATAFFLSIFYSPRQVSARTINVNCNSGQPIQTILASTNDGDIIRLSGACSANIVIDKNRIVLVAVGGATINGPDANSPPIRVRGLNVVIRDFASISGGNSSIHVERSGSAVISQNILENSARGILVTQGSYARIINNTIRNHAGGDNPDGITIRQSSAADIFFNTIENNDRRGITITDGSAADIDDNDILNNAADGILIQRTSHARLAGDPAAGVANLIQGNDVGVSCRQNSSLRSDTPQNFGTGNANGNTNTTGGCTVSGNLE